MLGGEECNSWVTVRQTGNVKKTSGQVEDVFNVKHQECLSIKWHNIWLSHSSVLWKRGWDGKQPHAYTADFPYFY